MERRVKDARELKALTDETRLKIIGILNSKASVGLGLLESIEISQPTLVCHVKILQDYAYGIYALIN